MGVIYVIGDIHGRCEKLTDLLREAGLVGEDLAWAGGSATLWFMGDFTDRGPDGIGVIDLVMRLQRGAAVAGGRVGALLGNHEPLLLAAHRFGDRPAGGPGGTFAANWLLNGGEPRDLARLTPEHVAWLAGLPALAHVGGCLLAHADSLFYLDYGDSVESVNAALAAVLQGDDAAAWDRLLSESAGRLDFAGEGGAARAAAFLRLYGGRRLIHGHTPIPLLTGEAPEAVTGPLVYAGGLCVNVDGGMYLGGRGFVYELRE